MTDDDAFRPQGGEFWPFEQRGDLYLVLTREPILYLGIGMDLMHTSETIRCHVEGAGQRLGPHAAVLLFPARFTGLSAARRPLRQHAPRSAELGRHVDG